MQKKRWVWLKGVCRRPKKNLVYVQCQDRDYRWKLNSKTQISINDYHTNIHGSDREMLPCLWTKMCSKIYRPFNMMRSMHRHEKQHVIKYFDRRLNFQKCSCFEHLTPSDLPYSSLLYAYSWPTRMYLFQSPNNSSWYLISYWC